MSTAHKTKSSFRDVFYSPKHFPKILSASMLCSTIAGYCTMESIHQNRLEVRYNSLFSLGWYIEKYSEIAHNSSFRYHTQRREQQYFEAFETYRHQKEVSGWYYSLNLINWLISNARSWNWFILWNYEQHHSEKYETALRPTLLQKRRFTKGTVVLMSPSSVHKVDAAIDRVRLVQEWRIRSTSQSTDAHVEITFLFYNAREKYDSWTIVIGSRSSGIEKEPKDRIHLIEKYWYQVLFNSFYCWWKHHPNSFSYQ